MIAGWKVRASKLTFAAQMLNVLLTNDAIVLCNNQDDAHLQLAVKIVDSIYPLEMLGKTPKTLEDG
jgi:hypothetical protein